MRQTGPSGIYLKPTPIVKEESAVIEAGYRVEEEEEDDCDDIIRSINSLLDKGKLYNRVYNLVSAPDRAQLRHPGRRERISNPEKDGMKTTKRR